MKILVVTLIVCIILSISYVFFDKNARKQKEEIDKNNMLILEFYNQEMNCMGKLELAGIEDDGNNDFEFKEAVKEINMPNNTKIQLYD